MVNFKTDLLLLIFCHLYLIKEVWFRFGIPLVVFFCILTGELVIQILLSHRLLGFVYYT